MPDKNINKVLLVGSSGGHLYHLWLLESWWKDLDRAWVTFDKEDSRSLLSKEKTYWCYFPTNRNIKNLIRNGFLALKIIKKERPDIIVSSGAGAAIPYFFLGKLFRVKTVFIEVYDRIDKPTLTGRLVYPFADLFIIQWEEQRKFFPNATLIGTII